MHKNAALLYNDFGKRRAADNFVSKMLKQVIIKYLEIYRENMHSITFYMAV